MATTPGSVAPVVLIHWFRIFLCTDPGFSGPGLMSPWYGFVVEGSRLAAEVVQYSAGGNVARITRTPAAFAWAIMLLNEASTLVAGTQSARRSTPPK